MRINNEHKRGRVEMNEGGAVEVRACRYMVGDIQFLSIAYTYNYCVFVGAKLVVYGT